MQNSHSKWIGDFLNKQRDFSGMYLLDPDFEFFVNAIVRQRLSGLRPKWMFKKVWEYLTGR